MSNDAAVAAIKYALEECDDDEDGMQFLRRWNEGEFDIIRDNWPNVPEEVFIGADPLHPETKAFVALSETKLKPAVSVCCNGCRYAKDHGMPEHSCNGKFCDYYEKEK